MEIVSTMVKSLVLLQEYLFCGSRFVTNIDGERIAKINVAEQAVGALLGLKRCTTAARGVLIGLWRK